jgi:uncharacterized membrane protein
MSASRPLLIGLTVSAALNLFLIGGIAGAVYMRGHAPREAAPLLARPPLWTAGQDLSPEHRRAFRQALRDAGRENQPVARQARQERRAVWEAMKAESFDPADASRRLAAARALDTHVRTGVDQAVVTFAAALPRDERAVLADGLRTVQGPRPKAPVQGSDRR